MGIPLPALTIKPPEQPDTLTNLSNLLHVKSQLQGQQTADLQQKALQQENQQRDVALKDQQAQTEAMKSWDGKNLQDLPGLLLKHGGSATAVFGLKQKIVEQQTALTKLDTDTLANQAKKNDFLLGTLQSATSGPDEGLPDRVNAAAADAVQKGYLDPQHAQAITQMTSQVADPKALRQQLTVLEKSFMGQKEQFDQEAKSRELAATEQRNALEAQRFAAQGPGGSMQPVDQKELSAYLANPKLDSGISKDAATFAAWKAKQAPLANFNLQMQAGGGLTKEALDQQAENYYQTGKLPPGGRGAAGIAQNRAIMNRAAELHSGQSLAEGSAEYAANKESLKKLQTQFDSVDAFEKTATKNIDRLLDVAKDVPDLGARFANVPVRMLSEKLIGTEAMARMKADLLTAQNESAKVLNSANASGVLSDSARHELQEMANGNLPYPAMVAAFKEIKNDMNNRHDSYAEQIQEIQKRIGGKSAASGAKTLSMAQIQKAAKDHGVSVDEATKQAKAAGYTVQ